MKAVTLWGEYYIVLIPEARVELVLPKQQYIEGLQRAKAWKRRKVQRDREQQMALAADEKRAERLQVERSSSGEG